MSSKTILHFGLVGVTIIVSAFGCRRQIVREESTVMASKENEKLVMDWFAAADSKDYELLKNLVTPDFRDHLAGRDNPATIDELLSVLKTWHVGFPDLNHHFDDVFSVGDRVVTRGSTSGTHKGEFSRIPPTGKRAELTFICIFQVANGRVSARWPQFDFYGWMEQLRTTEDR